MAELHVRFVTYEEIIIGKKAKILILLVLIVAAGLIVFLRSSSNNTVSPSVETADIASIVPSIAPQMTETIPTAVPTEEEKKEPVFTTDDDIDASADQIRTYLEQYTDNENLICAILGMFLKESRFFSYRVAHQRANSMDWTLSIDAGLSDGSTREYFIEYTKYTSGGYGLAMWSSIAYLEELYDFAQEWGTSIGDAEMQSAFVVYDLKNNYPDLYNSACSAKNAYQAGLIIGQFYERTSYYEGAAQNAQYYYDLFYAQTNK